MAVSAHPDGAGRHVDANGLRLHLLEYRGNGPPLILVPGITSPAATWEFVAEALSDDFHVYTLDNRGRGLSDKPAAGYTLPDYAADLSGIVAALGLEKPAIVGHSMGARIAAAFGALHAEAAGPLVVVDPPLSGPGRPSYPFPLPPYLESLRQAQAGATAEDMRRYFPTWTDEQLQSRADWLGTCDETAVVESYRNFHDEDFFTYWRTVRSPVLFLYGEDSPVVPANILSEITSTNPHARIASVPGAGHMIPWDNLAGFLTEVRHFLLGVTPGSGHSR